MHAYTYTSLCRFLFFFLFGTPKLAFSGTQAERGYREANYQTDVNVCATILKGVQLPHSCSVFPSLSHSLAAFPYSPFSTSFCPSSSLSLLLLLLLFLPYLLPYYSPSLPLCHPPPPLLHAKWKG